MKSDLGFTLIELLTIVVIIGVLSIMGLTSFNYYKAKAAYASAETTLRNARNAAEAGTSDADNLPAAVPLILQTSRGAIQNGQASEYLPGMMLPDRVQFRVYYDPNCMDASCQSDYIQVNHCFAEENVRWVRFGDGLELYLDHVAGGCG